MAELMAEAQAMCLKQPLTEYQAKVHLKEWGLIANEVGFRKLEQAVKDVLRNDSSWFPNLADIRRRAGMDQERSDKVEADAAWDMVRAHNRKWAGVGRMFLGRDTETGEPQYETAPRLPSRVEYAVRAVGGLDAIDNVRRDSEPFMRDKFTDAFLRAPLAETYNGMQLGVPEVMNQLSSIGQSRRMV
jgi:hypothetical protein